MKKQLNITLLSLSLILLFTISIQGQGINNNWHFGDNAALDFTTNPPSIIGSSQMQTLEGSTSISNLNGELLFYSDGNKVWNRYDEIMPNGMGLLGDASSTQSAIAVPHPGDTDLYYIFTTDGRNNGLINGFNYSIIDMSADNGTGDIIDKNIRLLGTKLVPEKVTAVKHGNEPAYWVITHGWGGSDANTYYVFKISESGLDPIPLSYNIGKEHGYVGGGNAQSRGYLKASPDGTLLACAIGENPDANIELFDFNNLTGEISNHRTVGSEISDPYGVEFSIDGTKLYATSLIGKKLVQIDLSNENIQVNLSSNDSDFELYGALQMSPKGTIYMATGGLSSGKRYLPGVTSPEVSAPACNFQKNILDLYPNTVRYGLPNTIAGYNTYINSTPVCADDNNTYPLAVNSGSGTPGIDYSCLAVTPNPSWFHFKIETSGNIALQLEPSIPTDIDFLCWGPFNNTNIVPEQLTIDKVKDCSYSPSSLETCNIDNTIVGEYYILLVTNIWNAECSLTISEFEEGSLDCSITEPCYSSDTDCDGVVDIVDVTNVAYLFGTQTGDVLFNEDFDLDTDGDIDIVDITIVAYDFGWTADSKEASSTMQNNNSNVQMYFTESIATDEPNTFETTLDISGVENLGAYEIKLNYDENNIDVISIEEGDLLENTNRTLFPIVSAFENGDINYAITSLGSENNGASGDGSILKIKFHISDENTAPFTMNNTQLLEINSTQIAYTFMANYTGINDFSEKSYSIQPNPVNDILYINYNYEAESGITFKIFDILGNQVLFHQEYKGTKGPNQTSIDMQKLPNGIYFVKMEMDKQIIETRKLIKK